MKHESDDYTYPNEAPHFAISDGYTYPEIRADLTIEEPTEEDYEKAEEFEWGCIPNSYLRSVGILTQERGESHGHFYDNSMIMDQIVMTMQDAPNWNEMAPKHRVALIYIAGKISRILAGDWEEPDHWDDIAGYAQIAQE